LIRAPIVCYRHPPRTHSPPPSLHDALPISSHARGAVAYNDAESPAALRTNIIQSQRCQISARHIGPIAQPAILQTASSCSHRKRSEEHTSELQSRSDLVCGLLLEKQKK